MDEKMSDDAAEKESDKESDIEFDKTTQCWVCDKCDFCEKDTQK
jgi:hypothetical protein